MLLLVSRKVHEVPQQKRLHNVRCLRQELLRLGQGGLLLVAKECGQIGGADGGRQLFNVSQQNCCCWVMCSFVLFSILWSIAGCHENNFTISFYLINGI